MIKSFVKNERSYQIAQDCEVVGAIVANVIHH